MEKLGNYFNSELNRYIGTKLPRIMTSIDLDLLQVKASRKIVRLAEYKHDKESVGDQQDKALKILGKFASVINANPDLFEGWKVQVVLIRGNDPYDNISVYCYVTDKTYYLNDKKQINKFLTLE
jgi:hypothetical protein